MMLIFFFSLDINTNSVRVKFYDREKRLIYMT